jgi:hypothetical protein
VRARVGDANYAGAAGKLPAQSATAINRFAPRLFQQSIRLL